MTINPGFGDVPPEFSVYKNSKIVILPVPFDATSTWLKGADKAPDAIIEASWNMYLYDIETDSEVYKLGIYTDKPVSEDKSPDKMVNDTRERITGHLQNNKFVVTIGGEHSVSIGSVYAHKEFFGNKVSVLQFDAHADLQDEYNSSKYNHACTMSRIREACPIVQVGIRSMDRFERSRSDDKRVFYAENIHSNPDWMDSVVELLTDTVYITIDIDAFDISIMPSTGTPEPGGLLWYDVLELLKKVTSKKKVIGFDVVELCPNEYSKPYDFLAAKLIYKLLSYIFNHP
ncbi:MAG: agmatinase [Spirochaetota bacterium]